MPGLKALLLYMLIAKQYTSAMLSVAIIINDLFTAQKYDFYMGLQAMIEC